VRTLFLAWTVNDKPTYDIETFYGVPEKKWVLWHQESDLEMARDALIYWRRCYPNDQFRLIEP